MSDFAPRDRLARLHAALLHCDSATLVLERWCGSPVTVRRVAGSNGAPESGLLDRLAVASAVELTFRRVELVAGGQVLSAAENWFVPARLTRDMVDLLTRTEAPFGHVVRSLAPRRVTLATRLGDPDDAVALEHRALLLAFEAPIAEVRERYPWSLLALGAGSPA